MKPPGRHESHHHTGRCRQSRKPAGKRQSVCSAWRGRIGGRGTGRLEKELESCFFMPVHPKTCLKEIKLCSRWRRSCPVLCPQHVTMSHASRAHTKRSGVRRECEQAEQNIGVVCSKGEERVFHGMGEGTRHESQPASHACLSTHTEYPHTVPSSFPVHPCPSTMSMPNKSQLYKEELQVRRQTRVSRREEEA